MIAHRGASAYRPENTLSAYGLAVEQAADMIEIDLHLTLDGAIVISHDADLTRFGAEGEIGQQTLEQLRELDATCGRSQPEPVPTLDEVLDRFGELIPFNLEIKWREPGGYPGLVEAALAALERRSLLARTLFSSFHDPVLAEVRRLAPGARLAVLVSPADPARALERADAVGAEAVNPHFALAGSDWIQSAHDAGLAVYPYTVDDEELMRHLLTLGVNGLFTNRPDRMRALVDG